MKSTPAQDERARYVRTLLAWHDITQSDLARVLGITQPAANRKLKGLRRFEVDELVAIADLFGVDAGHLLRPPALDDALGAPRLESALASRNAPKCEAPQVSGHARRGFGSPTLCGAGLTLPADDIAA